MTSARRTHGLGLPVLHVPANASRFFGSAEAARAEPTADIELGWDPTDPYLRNLAFDPGLIAHDEAYCTSVVDLDATIQVPTLAYLSDEVLTHLPRGPRIIDIGCGQGELVERLRAMGLDAVGYDPVVRQPSPHLVGDYWSRDASPADLYVMRCVLPHIADPWSFMHEIATSSPNALVLIEFQRLEWILEQSIWYQISHDHVNLFSVDDFRCRYDVVASGSFSADEWGWVLVRAQSSRQPSPMECPYVGDLEQVFAVREATLDAAASGEPLYVWGAAGKGIVLAAALQRAGADVRLAVDADPCRWDLYMEVSGTHIISPDEAVSVIPEGSTILVCNPNHLADIGTRAGGRWDLQMPSDLALGGSPGSGARPS